MDKKQLDEFTAKHMPEIKVALGRFIKACLDDLPDIARRRHAQASSQEERERIVNESAGMYILLSAAFRLGYR